MPEIDHLTEEPLTEVTVLPFHTQTCPQQLESENAFPLSPRDCVDDRWGVPDSLCVDVPVMQCITRQVSSDVEHFTWHTVARLQ